MNKCAHRGFTLVEISVVLVIIGLIAGGIIGGAALIRAAEIREMHGQYESYVRAMNTFQIKYSCMAGDCPNAEELFGSDPNGCPPPNDSVPNNNACNGNGDQRLFRSHEAVEAWRQLANAELIAGLFSGTLYSGASITGGPFTFTQNYKADYNCPPLLSSFHCWIWEDAVDNGVAMQIVDGDYGNTVLAMYSTSESLLPGSLTLFPFFSEAYAMGLFLAKGSWLLTPEEALAYDSKYDDGSPVAGKVLAQSQFFVKRCTTTQDAAAQYDLTQKVKNCAFFYVTGF